MCGRARSELNRRCLNRRDADCKPQTLPSNWFMNSIDGKTETSWPLSANRCFGGLTCENWSFRLRNDSAQSWRGIERGGILEKITLIDSRGTGQSTTGMGGHSTSSRENTAAVLYCSYVRGRVSRIQLSHSGELDDGKREGKKINNSKTNGSARWAEYVDALNV